MLTGGNAMQRIRHAMSNTVQFAQRDQLPQNSTSNGKSECTCLTRFVTCIDCIL